MLIELLRTWFQTARSLSSSVFSNPLTSRRKTNQSAEGGVLSAQHVMKHELRRMGWEACELVPQSDEQCRVQATSCRHTIVSVYATRHDAWIQAAVTAARLNRDNLCRGTDCQSATRRFKSGCAKLEIATNKELATEYERLRRRRQRLMKECIQTNDRLKEIERELPADCIHPSRGVWATADNPLIDEYERLRAHERELLDEFKNTADRELKVGCELYSRLHPRMSVPEDLRLPRC